MKLLAGFDDLADPAQVTATFHGKPLSPTRTLWSWLEYVVDPAQVRQGVNEITFTVKDGKPRLQDLALWVRPATGK